MTTKCPKCDHQRSDRDDPQIPDTQCPNCGIYYFKYINRNSDIPTPRQTPQIDAATCESRKRISITSTQAKTETGLHPSAAKTATVEQKKQTSSSTYFWGGIFTLIVFSIVTSKIKMHDYTATHAAEIAQREQACQTDIKCIGEKYESSIFSPCSRLIERYAKYQFKWDGIRFSRYAWGNNEKTTIKYSGDAVQFQNGFGAWQNMIYSCSYDPAANKVTDVAVTPGRLPL
jgi:predicted  nucleic acid-binding Zn-ribbon protein